MEMLMNIAEKHTQTVVVKYGGNAMINAELKAAVMQDLLALRQKGYRVVLVHGGGPDISEGLDRIGKQSQFINGLRVTDSETMDVVMQMLAGRVNKSLVALLHGQGVGICGVDARILTCEKLCSEADLGFVGEVTSVDVKLLEAILDAGYIPVIASVGVDTAGVVYNVNADTAASEIAIALGADKLVLMTNIAGVLRDRHDEQTLITRIAVQEVPELIASGVIAGGMIPKIQGCVDCIVRGVPEVSIIDGRVPHAVLLDMNAQTKGTLFYQGVSGG